MFDRATIPSAQNITSFEGYVFELSSKTWKISRQHKINLKWVDQLLLPDLAKSFVNVLSHYAQNYSSSHASNQCVRFQHFALERYRHHNHPLSKISAQELIGYRASLDREHEYYLGTLRGFLKSWADLEFPGIDKGVINLLANWRIRGNVKGRAVQILCPIEGPLSDLEFGALHQRLIDEFEKGAIKTEDFALVQIFMATGRRPVQLADLKIRDFIDAKAQDGLREFLLNIPRRKQRGLNWREEFRPFALTTDIGLLLIRFIEENKNRLFTLYNISSLSNFEEFPFFPKWSMLRTLVKQSQVDIDTALQSPDIHHTGHALLARVDAIVSNLEIPSERTGERLRVFPTRLRRTLATRAAREGFGELIIAELLDHTDTQNARVYTENVPEHVDAINEAMARQLAPLAQAFAGVIITKECDAVRGDDPTSRVRCESGNVGICGYYGFCGALAPIACYTCRNFQPWLDGPHEIVLSSLIAERDRILEITKDQVMAAVNDRTILAVTQVIQICEQHRAAKDVELSHG